AAAAAAIPNRPASRTGRRRLAPPQHVLVSIREDRPIPTAEGTAVEVSIKPSLLDFGGFFSVTPGGAAAVSGHVSLAVPEVSGLGPLLWAMENVLRDGDVLTVVNVRKPPSGFGLSAAALRKLREQDEEEALLRVTQAVAEVVRGRAGRQQQRRGGGSGRSKRRVGVDLASVIVAVEHGSEAAVLVRMAREPERAVTKVVMHGGVGGGADGVSGDAAARQVSEALCADCPVLLVSEAMIRLLGDHYIFSDDDDGGVGDGRDDGDLF
ncbi:hypothetical protein HK405_007752, partial [Cladochytrium tenue]